MNRVTLALLGALCAMGCGRKVTKSEAPAWRLEMESLSQAYFTGAGLDDTRRRRLSILLEFAGGAPAQADLVDADWENDEAKRAQAWRAWVRRDDGWRAQALSAARSAPAHEGCWALAAISQSGDAGCTGEVPGGQALEAGAGPYALRDRWAWMQFGTSPNRASARTVAVAWSGRWPNDPNAWYAKGLSEADQLGPNAVHWLHAVSLQSAHGPARESLARLSLEAGNWHAALRHLDAASAGRHWPRSQRPLRLEAWRQGGAVGRLMAMGASRDAVRAALAQIGVGSSRPQAEALKSVRVEVTVDPRGGLTRRVRRGMRLGPASVTSAPYVHVFASDGDLMVVHPVDGPPRIGGFGGAPTPTVETVGGQRTISYAASEAPPVIDEAAQPPLSDFAPRVVLGAGSPAPATAATHIWRFEFDLEQGSGKEKPGTLRITAKGAAVRALAEALRGRSLDDLGAWLQERLGMTWPDVRVKGAEVRAATEGEIVLEAALWFPVEARFGVGDSLAAPLAGSSLARLLWVSPRQTPLLPPALDENVVIRVSPSSRWKMQDTWATFDSQSRFGRLQQSQQRTEAGVELLRRITLIGGVIPQNEFAEFSAWVVSGQRRMMRAGTPAPRGDGG